MPASRSPSPGPLYNLVDAVVCDSALSPSLESYRTQQIPPFRGARSTSKKAPPQLQSIPASRRPTVKQNTKMDPEAAIASGSTATENENVPLLGGEPQVKKPFYRARPLWLVPFAVTAALVRGMTLAPRVEVFTQLSCNRLHGHHEYNHTQTLSESLQPHASLYSSFDPLGPHLHPSTSTYVVFPQSSPSTAPSEQDPSDDDDTDTTEDPRRLPSARCLSDPAVQAGAARLQTIMTTTMGLLSALTTGWWGHFGERHGRTRTLAIATFGLFLTDLTFILVSTPSSPFSQHGHKLLVLAPIIEGLLGGWSTLQSTTFAYISDCTSSGSRAHIFSRFTGVLYLGFAVGPSIGGWLIQHPLPFLNADQTVGTDAKMVTSVFWVAVACSLVNFLMVLCVFPESLDKEKRERAMSEYVNGRKDGKGKARMVVEGGASEEVEDKEKEGVIRRFLSPLSVFLPTTVYDPHGTGRKKTDWSLTLLGAALFGYMLSTGVYQLKYLYAEHVYGWGVEQLSYYISFMGGARAMFLLFLLPTIIATFKPKPRTSSKGKGPDTAPGTAVVKGKKPKPTRAELGNEIAFDLTLTRCSLLVDIMSNLLVSISPAPSFKTHLTAMGTDSHSIELTQNQSQALFVLTSSLSSLGSGVVPAVQSLALCMMQVRELNAASAAKHALATSTTTATAASNNSTSKHNDNDENDKSSGTGALFGALAVLQAVGQMIMGPLLFGLVYSGSVARFPKAIFSLAGGILVGALVLMLLVRNPVREVDREGYAVKRANMNMKGGARRRGRDGDVERGRSAVRKDLRGGAVVGYGSMMDGQRDATNNSADGREQQEMTS